MEIISTFSGTGKLKQAKELQANIKTAKPKSTIKLV